ncbi:uncharacterized protein K460DRAFT_279457 [Cucurbitaria berberidis CBS 394.84]|uniref:DSC E3 ubiquitin ligase complex subunit A n=1 Tax=Cucurbitaria berberidis CBS 394.84 TaxID=1168544 RepID=A0A9P4GPA0_9PLEO|nr:uncharacterized protein K460DRAFT_279457 [Cucurbitaria berberidis CBS 394.84]KAF1849317.1 hypothetical protein K460DRAFT_279457 [Cucurbitaria berberidis CBS 394.84]
MNPDRRADKSAEPGGSSSRRDAGSPDGYKPRRGTGPGYMTVGGSSTPEAAARLVSMLDDDSGYGGSLVDGETSWRSRIGEDRPSQSPTPILPGEPNSSEHEKQRSHVLQLRYNQNKNALGRAIHGTIDTLKSFQEMNLKWPAHYPSVQTETQKAHAHSDPRPGLHHTQSSLGDADPILRSPDRPRPPRRAGTTIGDDPIAESSSAAPKEKKEEPRLVTPKLAHDFSVLKLELRMGGRTQTDLVHSLEKSSIASLLDGQIQQSIRHLYAIKDRIEDTSSKVLVTGDLNAGKSTFCNALLRRKVLPEDQQPCTSIFCEVLDFRENGGVEEVHAVPIGSTYKRHDESTYTVFDLKDLEKIVVDNAHFSQCKVYIKDIRDVDESILNNGVVDIALIDAPGLNADSLKTTAVFARQEEIDVVVFVVSAANHFTESAKNFIFSAAREKAYMFMVVNGFDAIRDQQRCQEMILKQVHGLSPATFKESSELVHFVSSNAIPMQGSSPPGDDGDDDPSDGGKGKGKEAEKMRDFADLEASLRRFVLEKRARSKLAPAKTYLLNVLGDMNNLATVNRDVSQAELDRVRKEIDTLEPEFEESKKSRTEAGEAVDRMVEDTTSDVYGYTRDTLNNSIAKVGEQDLGIEYPGLFSAYQYAEDIRDSMLHEVTETVRLCEEHARTQAVQGYNGIKNLGVLHLGNNLYADVMFRPERMFRKSVHALARQVDIDIELWDFFDVASLWERQEKVAGTGMAVTVAGVVGGRLVGGVGWLDGALGAAKIMGSNNMKRLLIPGLIAGVAIGVSYILASVPKSLPHRLSAKLSQQLASIDYTHQNALRISSEIRRALKGPANDVRIGLQRNVEKLQLKKEETSKIKMETEVARKYFGNLVRSSNDLRQTVQRVDLEAAPPAAIAIRRDPRSFLFFIILLLLINSPEPQQPSFNARARYDELIEREYNQLDVLNRTKFGDFDAKKDQWLNITGLKDEDGFAWELLDPVKQKAKEQSERLLGERWKTILDGSLADEDHGIPVYKNLSGYVQGEWVRSPLSRVRHPSDMGNSSMVPDNPFAHLGDFDRNLTGTGGPLRLHFTELEDKMRRNKDKTVSEIGAKVVIGDNDSFGGNWWEFVAHGVHFLKSGTMVLTTTSDRYAGIFALPHLQISQHHYSTSQEFLNWTIHQTIQRQEGRVFPLWNPWTSSAEGSNEGLFQGHHCEFVLYLQEVPSQLNVDMDWLEHEMRYPTGAPATQHAQFAMSMVGFSPDCGFVIESKGPPAYSPSEATHLVGSKTEDFNVRARHSVVAFAIALAFQLSFLIKQMKETATPSMRSRVSFYTIAMMALGDGFTFLILIFMYLFLSTSQLALYSIAFIALFSVLTHLRFLMDIWSVQAAERARIDRQQASPAPSPVAQPAASLSTPAPPSNDEGLPLPATAPSPRPPTPIIIAPDQDEPLEDATPTPNNTTTNTNPRAELGALYSRFCLLLIVIFFVTIQFATARTAYRNVYFSTISFLYLSFWVPQIYRNVMRNCRKALRWDYIAGTSIVRLAPVAYFYLKEDNVLFSKTDWTEFAVLIGWVWVQIVALASQEVLGPRFLVKEGWAPPAYDYHPILREDEEGATMPLNINTSTSTDSPSTAALDTSSSSAEESTKAFGESKSKGKRVFDCSICAQDIEVPVIPAGADESSVAGMGSTSMILQRRQYMVTPCRHVFHTGCLEGWLRYRLQCPNCRESLPPL